MKTLKASLVIGNVEVKLEDCSTNYIIKLIEEAKEKGFIKVDVNTNIKASEQKTEESRTKERKGNPKKKYYNIDTIDL